MNNRVASFAVCLLALCACNSSHDVVAQPSDISLDTALTQTISALYVARARAELQRGSSDALGINPCTVTATFNIAATGSNNVGAGLSVSAKPPSKADVSTSGNLSVSNTSTADRGNQITVVFTTPACNPTGTLGTSAPSNVMLLERELEAARSGAPDPIKWPPGYQPIGGGGVQGGSSQSSTQKSAPEMGDKSSLNGPSQ